MLLAIDIGNTSITIGLYITNTLGPRWRLASDNDRTPDEYGILLAQLIERAGVQVADVREIAIASVVPPLTGTIERACRDYLDAVPLIVDAGTRTGIALRYEDPKQVGADRVVNAAAVRRLYQGPGVHRGFRHGDNFRCHFRGRGIPGRRHRSGHRHRIGCALPARGQAPPGRNRPPAVGDRAKHGAFAAIRIALRLCRAGGRDGGAFPRGARRRR